MKATKTGIFLFALAFFSSIYCSAQTGALKKGYAFSKPATYGREMKDLEGKTVKRPDSLYLLYLEFKGNEKPEFSSITYNGQSFTASVVPVTEKKVLPGVQKSTGKSVQLQRSSGSSFWLIELQPNGKSTSYAKGLVAKGKTGSRSFLFRQASWIFLKAEEKP